MTPRVILKTEEAIMVLAVLVHLRKKDLPAETEERSAIDLRDVLIALRISGYTIVPVGVIDAIKRQLLPYGTDTELDKLLHDAEHAFDMGDTKRKRKMKGKS